MHTNYCINSSAPPKRYSKQRKSPFCLTLGRLHWEYHVQFWHPQSKKDIEILKQVQWMVTDMMRGDGACDIQGKPERIDQVLRNLFIMRLVTHKHSCPERQLSISLEILKLQLDKAVTNNPMLLFPFFEGGLNQLPSNQHHYVLLHNDTNLLVSSVPFRQNTLPYKEILFFHLLSLLKKSKPPNKHNKNLTYSYFSSSFHKKPQNTTFYQRSS